MDTKQQQQQSGTGQQSGSQQQLKPTEIVRQHFKAIEEKNFDKARSFLANDFQFSGITPEPMDGAKYIEVHKSLLGGLKDWRYNFTPMQESENQIEGKVKITGTHTGELRLPMLPGAEKVSPTNKKINMPEERVNIQIKGGKIARFSVEQVPNGGMDGLLSQLGVHLHH